MRTAFHYLRQFIYQDKEGKEVLGSQAIVRVRAALTSTRLVQSRTSSEGINMPELQEMSSTRRFSKFVQYLSF